MDIKPAYRETKSHAFIGTVLCIDDIKCFYFTDCAAATSRNVSVLCRFTAACVETVAPHHFGHHTNQPGWAEVYNNTQGEDKQEAINLT